MMQPPLAHELDPLDAHLADLEEEPGSTFLQDFLGRAPLDTTTSYNTTPLSSGYDTPNGYTSEDTDYSAATPPPPAYASNNNNSNNQQQHQQQQYKQFPGPSSPSDEQMYQDMSFLQSADTHELVEAVADFCSTEDLATLSPQTQHTFANKVIKGKTSKYRGVTQTSKTSWGAKYSAKRITNTCKTPDDAAHAYDRYLQQHYPHKYAKYANFCAQCGQFVNPLGLLEYTNECSCTDRRVPYVSSGGDMTSPESSTAGSPMSSASNSDGSSTVEQFRGSNLSVGSMQFRFSDGDNDTFLDESFRMVASFETANNNNNANDASLVAASQQLQTRDSLPIAVIHSAVESFTQEDNLDQIIEAIHRPSLHATHQQQPQPTTFSDALHTATTTQIEPTNAAYVDFSLDELHDLSEYFMADQFVPAESMTSDATTATTSTHHHAMLKKTHSLEFDMSEIPLDALSPSHGSIKLEQHYRASPPALLQTSSMQDIDAIANSFMLHHHPSRPQALTSRSTVTNAFPAVIDIATPFLEKYWRNDRKNIQCFPYCPEHGDYYRVRIEDLQHRCKGVCRAAVKAHVTIPMTQPLVQHGLHVLARCNSTFSRNVALSSQAQLTTSEMKSLDSLSAVGVVDAFVADASSVQFDVTFYPDVWKFEFDLPKKRRNVAANSPVESDVVDHLGSEFLYFFEIDVFYSPEKTTFARLGHSESINFQIGNTRTLLRQRNKMSEDVMPQSGVDRDRVLDIDTLPEKKKVKIHYGQRELPSMSDDNDASGVHTYNDAKPKEQPTIASDSKRDEHLPVTTLSDVPARHDDPHPTKPIGKDPHLHLHAKDPALSMTLSDAGVVSTPHGNDTQASNYATYLSPKTQEPALAAVTDASSVRSAAHRSNGQKPPVAPATYSLPKLLTYTLACVLLSVVYVPLTLLLLVVFLVLPPLAPSVVRVLDTLSDAELRNANSSCIPRDARRVLDRLSFDPAPNSGSQLLRYHAHSSVYARFAYFAGVKLLVSVVAVVPTLVLSVVALLTFPVRAVSRSIASAACSCALWTREYTRSSVGKPFAGAAMARGDAIELV